MWNGCWGTCAAEIRYARHHRNRSHSGALLARNPYNTEFPDRVAFFDVDDGNRTLTATGPEFIGRNGTWRARRP
jgi:cellobiose phosphorylase